jgi:hypothetical protein
VEGEQMQAQIRIYTINKGELDNFIKHFNEETKPLHDKVGSKYDRNRKLG